MDWVKNRNEVNLISEDLARFASAASQALKCKILEFYSLDFNK
jgi:hypothetical protein